MGMKDSSHRRDAERGHEIDDCRCGVPPDPLRYRRILVRLQKGGVVRGYGIRDDYPIARPMG